MEIDCRGKACPQPVLMAKQALEESGGEFTVIVDDPGSRENVERFLRQQGASVNVERKGNDFFLLVKKATPWKEPASFGERKREIIVYINSNRLGIGDEALGSILIRSFLKTLVDSERKPSRLILINSGVKLAAEGSEVLETLALLSGQGVKILSCGTCLDFYGLKERMRVGAVSNMYEIVQSLIEADCVIRP